MGCGGCGHGAPLSPTLRSGLYRGDPTRTHGNRRCCSVHDHTVHSPPRAIQARPHTLAVLTLPTCELSHVSARTRRHPRPSTHTNASNATVAMGALLMPRPGVRRHFDWSPDCRCMLKQHAARNAMKKAVRGAVPIEKDTSPISEARREKSSNRAAVVEKPSVGRTKYSRTHRAALPAVCRRGDAQQLSSVPRVAQRGASLQAWTRRNSLMAWKENKGAQERRAPET